MKESQDDLADAVAALERLEERVAAQRATRNRLIIKTLADGTTWTRAQEITGLSRQAIANIVKGES